MAHAKKCWAQSLKADALSLKKGPEPPEMALKRIAASPYALLTESWLTSVLGSRKISRALSKLEQNLHFCCSSAYLCCLMLIYLTICLDKARLRTGRVWNTSIPVLKSARAPKLRPQIGLDRPQRCSLQTLTRLTIPYTLQRIHWVLRGLKPRRPKLTFKSQKSKNINLNKSINKEKQQTFLNEKH